MSAGSGSSVGAVAIGKNEGERLRICLQSLAEQVAHVVYVDSGSSDGSVDLARSMGADVVELDPTTPFTAARARNAGVDRLSRVAHELKYAQLIDGDCELLEGWIENAVGFLEANREYAAAAGRLRERFPDASVYNYLCDVEWNTPVGEITTCGGIVVMRIRAFESVGGFTPHLIAGEEPDLCARLRRDGWRIRRLEAEMALHDAAMTRFSQWWKRAVRAGHAYAEGSHLHGAPPERMGVRESRRIVAWGLILPALAVGVAPVAGWLSWLVLLAYPLNVIRLALRMRAQGRSRPWSLGFFLMLAKFPEAIGWVRFQWGRLTGNRSRIIEHKGLESCRCRRRRSTSPQERLPRVSRNASISSVTKRPAIVNVSELGRPAWHWVGGRFPTDPFRWLSFSGRPESVVERKITRPRIARYRACWEAARTAKREDAKLIVSHTPLMSAWTNIFCKAMGVKVPHLAFSFTFSTLPTGIRRRFFVNALRGIDRFVCFSSVERTRYSQYFDIPQDRIDSLPWSVAEPAFDLSAAPIERPPYLCAIGREGRDYATLVEAMRRLPDHHLAIVARPDNVQGLDLPPNVSVRTNIPLAEVWNLMANAKLMVLPLHDTEVPCGHGTLIMAMQLETPSIVTESAAMVDYVSDETTGLICPPGDPDAMARTIQRLWDDQVLATNLVRNGRTFATEECGEGRTVAYFTDYAKSLGLL